jgi:hypothetical protein
VDICYITHFFAIRCDSVVKVNTKKFLILNKTVFYSFDAMLNEILLTKTFV